MPKTLFIIINCLTIIILNNEGASEMVRLVQIKIWVSEIWIISQTNAEMNLLIVAETLISY